MEKYSLSRKARRKAAQNKLASAQIKKGTTVLSSALVVSSIAAPIAAPKIAEAAEDTSKSAEVEYTTSQSSADAVPEETSSTKVPTIDSQTQTTSDSEVTQSTEDTLVGTGDSGKETPASETDAGSMATAVAVFSARAVSSDPSTFIAEIAGHAQSVAADNDLYASVMMAQAILESDWGRSTLSTAPNYNLFGIKGSYQGQSVTMSTWEVFNGQWVQVNAAFRKYPSYSESFADNAYVLRNTSFQSGLYYYSGAWKSNTNSYQDATAWLRGRYATDPTYNTKLNGIIASYNLTQYDTPASGGNTGGNTSTNTGTNMGSTNNSNTTSTGQNTTYTVKSGDSLWLLAQQYGTTIANIKSWNNLSGDMIYVGQKLVVGKASSSSSNTTTGNTTTGGSNAGNSSTTNTATSSTYYTVKSGDSLWAIANANGISITNLRQWNNISGDVIYPGQRLVIKQGSGTSGSANGSTTGTSSNTNNGSSTTTAGASYTVKSGDSLWAIANANGVSIANLRQWNNISGDMIYPGQRLVVKQGTGASSTTSGSTAGTSSNNSSSTTASASYTVKSGDSLWAIASANGVSIANLRQWNNINGDMIYPGQRLVVKQGNGNAAPTTSNNQSTTQAATSSHKVKSGDTLWGLSQTYGTSVQKIKQLNGLSSDLIYIGQLLKVK